MFNNKVLSFSSRITKALDTFTKTKEELKVLNTEMTTKSVENVEKITELEEENVGLGSMLDSNNKIISNIDKILGNDEQLQADK